MGKSSVKVRGWLVFIVGAVGLVLSSCATRNPIEMKAEALEMLRLARKKNPDHPDVSRATESFDEASRFFVDGQYGLAGRYFADSVDYSRSIINAPAVALAEPGPDVEVWAERQAIEDEATKNLVASADSRVEKPLRSKSTVAFPSNSPVEVSPVEPLESTATTIPAPLAAVKAQAPAGAVSAPVVTEEKRQVFPEAKKIEEIKSSSPASLVVPPSLSDLRVQETERVRLKEKIPGVVVFGFNDPLFQSSSRDLLERVAKILRDSPSSSIVFQAQISQGEDAGLVDVRFKSLRNYLKERRVNDDQMVLDDKRTVGDWPEFRLYQLN